MLHSRGHQRVREILSELQIHAQKRGVALPMTSQTPYVNTILAERQPPYPGNRELERRIKSIIRWNAMAMVVKANRENEGIGGHIRFVLVVCDAVRSRLQSFLSRAGSSVWRRPGVLSRARVAGHLLARLRGRSADAKSSCTISAATWQREVASPRIRIPG